ncbi:MAG TPA: lysylphosphatidylglycerol synthase domain-containing protein [Gaiellaceae bacterium]|nr:lysylphosphatidylglycerol synthase domain-containing protein [Gaiellaceae bacterium]
MSAVRFDGRPVPPLWQLAAGLAAAALLVAGVVALIAHAAGFAEVRSAVEEADTLWLLVCLAAQAVALAGYAQVFREAFRWQGGPEPGFRLSVHIMLASVGATRVVAAGGAGALAATYWCFRRARFPRREALVRVLGFNTLYYVPFAAGTWLAALVASVGVWGEAPLGLTGPWLGVVPACVAAAAFVTQPARVGRLTRPGGSVLRRGLALGIAGTAWVREVALRREGRRSLIAAGLFWGGNVVSLWAALESVGEQLPLPELVLAFATGQAAMLLPLPLGGVGGVDAALTYSLTAVGVPLAPALVGVSVYRLFAFWAPTPPALAALVLLPRAGRELERVALEPA